MRPFVYIYICHVFFAEKRHWIIFHSYLKSTLNFFLFFLSVFFVFQFYQRDCFLSYSVISLILTGEILHLYDLRDLQNCLFLAAVEMESEMNPSTLGGSAASAIPYAAWRWSFISWVFEMTTVSHCLDCQLSSWSNKMQPMLWHKPEVWFWKSQRVCMFHAHMKHHASAPL